jgi:uncharacterized protein
MGQPVVRFEVRGNDARALQSFYAELFDWKIASHGSYGMVDREGNVNADGVGIGGGIVGAPGVPGHVTFYVEVPDVETALARAEHLGGTRVMGPQKVRGRVQLGFFRDPEGHLIGVIRSG